MSRWPQIRIASRNVSPWPCLRCMHLAFAVQVVKGRPDLCGKVNDECSVERHRYLLLASYDEQDCDDFVKKD